MQLGAIIRESYCMHQAHNHSGQPKMIAVTAVMIVAITPITETCRMSLLLMPKRSPFAQNDQQITVCKRDHESIVLLRISARMYVFTINVPPLHTFIQVKSSRFLLFCHKQL